MQRKLIGLFVLALMALPVWSVQADDWQWPSLNPFASSKPKDLSRKVSNSSGSWLPGWGASTKRKGPSTWDKMKAAPASAMTKTKNTLAPLNPFASTKKTTTKKKSGTSSRKKESESSGWWPDWMTTEEEPRPPLTVTDWLDAERPGF